MIAWIDRGIFLSSNRLVVSVVLRNFDVPELSGGLFLFFSFSFVRRKLCANSFASFTVQEIYGNFFFEKRYTKIYLESSIINVI